MSYSFKPGERVIVVGNWDEPDSIKFATIYFINDPEWPNIKLADTGHNVKRHSHTIFPINMEKHVRETVEIRANLKSQYDKSIALIYKLNNVKGMLIPD
jgi:hypothetical protein